MLGNFLRSIQAANVIGLQADSTGHLTSSTIDFEHNGTLAAYANRGTRLGQMVTGLNGGGTPVVTAANSVWVNCGDSKVCEYGAAKHTIITPHYVVSVGVRHIIFDAAYYAVDRSGDLAVSGGSQDTIVFVPGSKKPYWKVSNGGNYIGAIAFDKAGDLYVARGNPTGDAYNQIAIYAQNKKTPKLILDTPSGAYVTWMQFDAAGNLYALAPQGCINCASPSVGVYQPNKTQPAYAITDGLASSTSLNLAVDPSGHVYVSGCTGGGNSDCFLNMYAPHTASPYFVLGEGLHAVPYIAASQ